MAISDIHGEIWFVDWNVFTWFKGRILVKHSSRSKTLARQNPREAFLLAKQQALEKLSLEAESLERLSLEAKSLARPFAREATFSSLQAEISANPLHSTLFNI